MTTFKAFVRAVGHGLPGANGFCLLLPSERRAGRRRRPCSCLGPVPIPCRAAAPRQVGPTWAFQMPSNGLRATAPAGARGEQPHSTCLPMRGISDTSTSIQGRGPGSLSSTTPSSGKGTPEAQATSAAWVGLCERDSDGLRSILTGRFQFSSVKWENGTICPGTRGAGCISEKTGEC